ncbi:MAG: mechanosensitive ion channel family protein [Nanoarchaeota archaeon]
MGLESYNLTILVNSVDTYLDSVGIHTLTLKAGFAFLIFLILAFFIRVIFKTLLSRLVKGTKTDIDDKIINATQTPVFILIIVLGLFVSGKIIGLDDFLGVTFLRVFLTLFSYLIFIILFRIILLLSHGVKEVQSSKKLKVFEDKIFPFFERGMKIFLGIIYLFVFFSIWKFNLTPLLASAGLVGIALAFAAQSTIANIFGGISLFLDKTYEIGDYIIIDNDRGEIIDIGLRSTKVRTRDDVLITIPNSVMAGSKVINESGIYQKLRIRIDVNVSYDSDLDKVEKVLLNIAKKSDYIEKDPKPSVRFRAFGDSGIALQFQFWIKEPSYRGLYTSLAIKEIHKRFRKEGIEIPYPIRSLYIKKDSEIKVRK